jgi:polysaccharide deacetylase family protein (PEP-CTERM system associated)
MLQALARKRLQDGRMAPSLHWNGCGRSVFRERERRPGATPTPPPGWQNATQSDPPTAHVLTVDVEDYFQVEAFAGYVHRESWDQWPCRVVENTERLLDLFERREAKGTFFFLGWVAARFPKLVRQVQARGHELACHSYWHRAIYSLAPERFRRDTRLAKHVIEDAAGTKVIGYRAPRWSITKECVWALDILAEEGFLYDSSIYPVHHDLDGLPEAGRFPYIQECDGLKLREYAASTLRFLGTNFPVAVSGYLRILPAVYTEIAFRVFEKKYGKRVIVQLHPWELDPDQPRIPAKWRSRLRHYTNLGSMSDKVSALLQGHRFERFCDVLAAEETEPGGRARDLSDQEPPTLSPLSAKPKGVASLSKPAAMRRGGNR